MMAVTFTLYKQFFLSSQGSEVPYHMGLTKDGSLTHEGQNFGTSISSSVKSMISHL